MAKVLKQKQGVREVAYASKTGGDYPFGNTGVTAGLCLVQNDAHADELLEKYPNELVELAHDKWPAVYKEKAEAFSKSRIEEATKMFPDVVGKIISPKGEKK